MGARGFLVLLLAGGLAQLVVVGLSFAGNLTVAQGLHLPPFGVVGDDFVNLYNTARMVLAGMAEQVYVPSEFMAFQRSLVPAHLGLRLWAYPPHSLLLVPPFGLLGYFEAYTLWSAIGLLVLALGARRMGFDRLEVTVLLLSPAALASVLHGQSGSLATGLLLLALAARRDGDPLSVGAAALLTVKPQIGLLLPVAWLVRRQWRLVVATALVCAAVAAASVAAFGFGPWADYVGVTLRALDQLEREGTGPFMIMIPSAFMAIRILTGDGDLAAILHLVFAAAVGVFVLWRLAVTDDRESQNVLVLLGTALVTPYLHNYDLALLLCAGLLLARRAAAMPRPLIVYALVVLAWSLPSSVVLFNLLGAPVSPLIVVALLWLACRKPAGIAPQASR